MFRIAICDDEPHFREQMKEMLLQYMQDSGVYYEIELFQSGTELIELGIELNRYKIIFLDINMDEMDGIQTAKRIREQNTELFLVFVTAFVNYSIAKTTYEIKTDIAVPHNTAISMKTFLPHKNGGFDCYFSRSYPVLAHDDFAATQRFFY